ncbi:(4Fe-4S)-binding protein [Saccharopolyspora sp. HNM0986]|nr:(4Fe-4S)-binding protein [Saccharopolyspora sp. HNM0986]MBK0866829.1 (4Fe-4S)-binding protein [Saccharopolyspora sp. HNM0986]
MKVTADERKCCGSGQCVLLAPEVFDQRDDVTLLAPSPSKNSTNRARSGRRPPCGAIEAHG